MINSLYLIGNHPVSWVRNRHNTFHVIYIFHPLFQINIHFKNSDVKFFLIIYAILNYSLSTACLKNSDVQTFLLFVEYLTIFNQLSALSAKYIIQPYLLNI